MDHSRSPQTHLDINGSRAGEQGWALLGLLLALTIMAMVLASAVVPNVQMSVVREKENEMMYRGEQMARAIARYYNQGRLGEIQIFRPPPYGYLTELKKIRDGVTIGVREIKFVRPSAYLDPFSNEEWEPVRARDPRVRKLLDNFAASTGFVVPNSYWLLAGPPQRLVTLKPTEPVVPAPGQQPGIVTPGQPPRNQDPDIDDDDDLGDGEDPPDPLAHIFGSSEPGSSNIPIIGVAPKKKGRAIHSLYGMDNYEDWVFIFIPQPGQFLGAPAGQPPGNARPRGGDN
jgi:type II secretory pathway pseudopilin PulG